jgi:hypothetical protein
MSKISIPSPRISRQPAKNIFTDVYMYDLTLGAEVEAFALYLERNRTSDLPTNNYDLVLDVIVMENDEIVWAYYYVDHDSRTLFWQDSYECGDSILSEVHGVKEASHVSAYFSVWANTVWINDIVYPRASIGVTLLVRRLILGLKKILTVLIRNEGYIGHFILLAPTLAPTLARTSPSVSSHRRPRKSCLGLY